MTTKRRVVVTGLGVVSPVGSTVDSFWAALLAGESGIGPITYFDASAYATKFAGQVKGFQVEDFIKVLRGAKVIGFRPWFIEVAFWDIIGKAAGQPVYRLLGGSRDRVKAYASTGELRDPETRAQDALRLVEEGFTGIKLRIRNEDPRVDLAVVEAVRVAVGDDVEIMVDANQAWLIHGFAAYPRWDLKRAMYMAKAPEAMAVGWPAAPMRTLASTP